MTRTEIIGLLAENGVDNPDKAVVSALLNRFNEEKRNIIAETTNKVMDDIKEWASPEEFQKLKSENEELKKKIEGFEDYDELKQFKEESVAREEKQTKIDYLKSVGCKHPELFVDKVDFTKGKYNAEKKTYEGLDDGVKVVKEQYKDMFENNDSKPNTDITLGALDNGKGKEDSNFNQDFRAAFGIN